MLRFNESTTTSNSPPALLNVETDFNSTSTTTRNRSDGLLPPPQIIEGTSNHPEEEKIDFQLDTRKFTDSCSQRKEDAGKLKTNSSMGIGWGAPVGSLQTQNQNNKIKSDNPTKTTNTMELYISPPPRKKEYEPIRLSAEYVANKEKSMALLIKKDVPFGKYKPSKKSSIICEVLVSEVDTVKTNEETGVKFNSGESKTKKFVGNDGGGGNVDSFPVDDNVNPTNPNNQKTSESGSEILSNSSRAAAKDDDAESKTEKVIIADGGGGNGDISSVVDIVNPLDPNNQRISESGGELASASFSAVDNVKPKEKEERGLFAITFALPAFAKKKKKVHPADTSNTSNTENAEKSENNNNTNNTGSSTEKAPTLNKITNTLRGQASTTVHLDYTSLSCKLMDFGSDDITTFLHQYHTNQQKQEKKVGLNYLPILSFIRKMKTLSLYRVTYTQVLGMQRLD